MPQKMPEKQQTQNQFNANADAAARALRQSLQKQGRDIADSSPVAVGPDGKPPAALPPEGSYARQAIDQQRAQAANRAEVLSQIGDQPPAGTIEQRVDGSPGQPLLPPAQAQQVTPNQPAPEVSPNAEARIRKLVDELRERDKRLAEIEGRFTGQQSELEKLRQQNQEIMQANLDHLDPEQRLAVLQDARIAEAVQGLEDRLLQRISPHLNEVRRETRERQLMGLGEKYPNFDYVTHGPMIEMVQAKYPAMSIEMAYRAATFDDPDATVTRDQAVHVAVPPVVQPGPSQSQPRYMPEPTDGTRSNARQEVAQEIETMQEIKRLRSSGVPQDQLRGMELINQELARRAGLT